MFLNNSEMAAVFKRHFLVLVIMSSVFALLFVHYLFDDWKKHVHVLPKISGSNFTEKDIMGNVGKIFPNKCCEYVGANKNRYCPLCSHSY